MLGGDEGIIVHIYFGLFTKLYLQQLSDCQAVYEAGNGWNLSGRGVRLPSPAMQVWFNGIFRTCFFSKVVQDDV